MKIRTMLMVGILLSATNSHSSEKSQEEKLAALTRNTLALLSNVQKQNPIAYNDFMINCGGSGQKIEDENLSILKKHALVDNNGTIPSIIKAIVEKHGLKPLFK